MTNQTQTPKPATSTTSNPFAAFAFDPTQMFAPAQLWTESMARVQAAVAQYGAFEQEMIVRAQGAVQTWAQLATDALAYAGQLAVEARKIGLPTVAKSGN